MQPIDEVMESWLGADWGAPTMTILRVLMIVILAVVAQRVAGRFLRRLKAAFDSCGIEIPHPQVTFHAAADRGAAAASLPPQLK